MKIQFIERSQMIFRAKSVYAETRIRGKERPYLPICACVMRIGLLKQNFAAVACRPGLISTRMDDKLLSPLVSLANVSQYHVTLQHRFLLYAHNETFSYKTVLLINKFSKLFFCLYPTSFLTLVTPLTRVKHKDQT